MRSVALAGLVAALTVRVGQAQRVPPPFASFSYHIAATVNEDSGSTAQKPRRPSRRWVVGGLQFAGGVLLYGASQRTWGSSHGHFHVKQDWTGDGLGQNDEASHLFFGYTLTRAFAGQWRWGGLAPSRSRSVGAFESAFVLTLVEVLDAFNPAQGFGISDLAFDYAGVGAGLWILSHPGNWSITMSAKDPAHAGFAETKQQSDNWIFWAIYRPSLGWGPKQPLSLGLGHSVRRASDGVSPVRELHFGIGTTVPDLVRAVAPGAARYVRILDFYYLNLNFTATLR